MARREASRELFDGDHLGEDSSGGVDGQLASESVARLEVSAEGGRRGRGRRGGRRLGQLADAQDGEGGARLPCLQHELPMKISGDQWRSVEIR